MVCGTNPDGSHVCGDVWSDLECDDKGNCWQDCERAVGLIGDLPITLTEDKMGVSEGGDDRGEDGHTDHGEGGDGKGGDH